jgi:hypothetical protein
MATAKRPPLFALGNIHHNGREYAAGDEFPGAGVEATDEQVEALRSVGILSSVPPVLDPEPAEG